jgi:hypothetical protein
LGVYVDASNKLDELILYSSNVGPGDPVMPQVPKGSSECWFLSWCIRRRWVKGVCRVRSKVMFSLLGGGGDARGGDFLCPEMPAK